MPNELDAHAKPPDELRLVYKYFQKLKGADVEGDGRLADLQQQNQLRDELRPHRIWNYDGEVRKALTEASSKLHPHNLLQDFAADVPAKIQSYTHGALEGLEIVPGLIPPNVQIRLLDRMLHRDVSEPQHQSNIHLHYDVAYPSNNRSFFSEQTDSSLLQTPKDPSIHRPISVSQLLNKKLRWITLGGQYDWTNKIYPDETPPAFPTDIAELLGAIFPQMSSQAAIVNFYSPGDTLSLHRDVAEECDRGLVSISIGCDAIFVLGIEGENGCDSMAIRLHSGDAVLMDGKSRYAWHGVPQIIPGTCPQWLEDWPGEEYPQWKGWMAQKRINLNVRQMRE